MDIQSQEVDPDLQIHAELQQLSAQSNDASLLLADYINERKLFESGLVEEHEFKDFRQKIVARIANLPEESTDNETLLSVDRISVFLSYNHHDQQTATRIKQYLGTKNINLRMDLSDVKAGQPIKEFIIEQTRENNAIMLLISRHSLTSVWVSYESNIAIFNELINNKRIIPISLDGEYLNNGFYAEACDQFDTKIHDLDEEINILKKKGRDPRLLDTERQQLLDSSKQLAPILEKLRQIAVYMLNEDNFEKRLAQVAEQLSKHLK